MAKMPKISQFVLFLHCIYKKGPSRGYKNSDDAVIRVKQEKKKC